EAQAHGLAVGAHDDHAAERDALAAAATEYVVVDADALRAAADLEPAHRRRSHEPEEPPGSEPVERPVHHVVADEGIVSLKEDARPPPVGILHRDVTALDTDVLPAAELDPAVLGRADADALDRDPEVGLLAVGEDARRGVRRFDRERLDPHALAGDEVEHGSGHAVRARRRAHHPRAMPAALDVHVRPALDDHVLDIRAGEDADLAALGREMVHGFLDEREIADVDRAVADGERAAARCGLELGEGREDGPAVLYRQLLVLEVEHADAAVVVMDAAAELAHRRSRAVPRPLDVPEDRAGRDLPEVARPVGAWLEPDLDPALEVDPAVAHGWERHRYLVRRVPPPELGMPRLVHGEVEGDGA